MGSSGFLGSGLFWGPRGLVDLVREDGLARREGGEGQTGAENIVQRSVQGEQQGVAQPHKAHQIDRQNGHLLMGGHGAPPHKDSTYILPPRGGGVKKIDGFTNGLQIEGRRGII